MIKMICFGKKKRTQTRSHEQGEEEEGCGFVKLNKEVKMSINYKVVHQILIQVNAASPLGVEDETKINIEEADMSDEEKRAYLDWLFDEGYIKFNVFGESADAQKGIAKNIIITEEGIKKLRGYI